MTGDPLRSYVFRLSSRTERKISHLPSPNKYRKIFASSVVLPNHVTLKMLDVPQDDLQHIRPVLRAENDITSLLQPEFSFRTHF